KRPARYSAVRESLQFLSLLQVRSDSLSPNSITCHSATAVAAAHDRAGAGGILSGHPIAGLYLPKARAWRRAPCRNPPSLRISSPPLLDCSGRVPRAPDLLQGLRAAFPLWRSRPPTQCQLRRAPTVPRRASPSSPHVHHKTRSRV